MELARDVPPKHSSHRRSLAHALRKARALPATRVMEASKQGATHAHDSRASRPVVSALPSVLPFAGWRRSPRKRPARADDGVLTLKHVLLPEEPRGSRGSLALSGGRGQSIRVRLDSACSGRRSRAGPVRGWSEPANRPTVRRWRAWARPAKPFCLPSGARRQSSNASSQRRPCSRTGPG
jgi:hypothetical protein